MAWNNEELMPTSLRLSDQHKTRLDELGQAIGCRSRGTIVQRLIDSAEIRQEGDKFSLATTLTVVPQHKRRDVGQQKETVATRVSTKYAEGVRRLAREHGVAESEIARAIIIAFFDQENNVAGFVSSATGHVAGPL